MKIKKTYTYSKVGLFVGLLSFHTLSSCANTGRKLGICPNLFRLFESKEAKKQRELEREADKRIKLLQKSLKMSQKTNQEPSLWKKPIVLIPIAAAVTAIPAGIWGIYQLYLSSSASGLIPANTTVSGNGTGGWGANAGLLGNNSGNISTSTMSPELAQSITDSIRKGEEKWGDGRNNSSNITTTTPSTGNDLDTKLSACPGFNNKPENPKDLPQDRIDFLMKNKFSLEPIKCVFSNGLDPDAMDTNDNTACIGAAKFQQEESVRFLEPLGEGCYSLNKDKNSAMDFLNLRNPEGRKIANFLGASDKPDLCKKNRRGKSFKDKPGKEGLSEIVQNKLKNCS